MNALDNLLGILRANRTAGRWEMSAALYDPQSLSAVYGNLLRHLLEEFFIAFCCLKKYEKALEVMTNFQRTYVDDHLIAITDCLFGYIRNEKRIVATMDPLRQPRSSEIVVCYGDYPHIYENLAHCNPIRRHLQYFWNLDHDEIEYSSVWDPIDQIYIVNVDERIDRYIETLRELRRMKAPFHRIRRFSAIKDESTQDSYFNGTVGCARSHLAVLEESLNKGYQHVLVLEDDFCFTDDIAVNQNALKLFFERRYDYDICLLATSKYYRIEPYDDLLNRSYQECTTTAGFLYSRSGMEHLYGTWKKGLEDLIVTRNTVNACDRSWRELQKESRFFVFKQKLGFQRPSYSSITGKTEFHLD